MAYLQKKERKNKFGVERRNYKYEKQLTYCEHPVSIVEVIINKRGS